MKLLDDFKYFNRVKILNRWVQFFLTLLLFFGFQTLLPYLQVRFDFSQNHQNSLCSETKAFLQSLKQPLQLFLLKDNKHPDNTFARNFKKLLLDMRTEFSKNKGVFEFQEIDTLKSPKTLLQIQERYKFEGHSGLFMVLGQKTLLIPFENFYKNKIFIGETCLLNALQQLTASPKVVYWLTGHGELSGQNVHPTKGGSTAYKSLKQSYCDIRYLETCNSIPEDAATIVIFGPQLPFLPQECTQLKNFIQQRHGHVWICLNPIYEHGLNEFLNALGIACKADLLLDNSNDFLSNDGNLIIRRFNQHAITQALIHKNLGLVFGLATTLKLNDSHLFPCILSSESSWVKTSNNLKNLSYDTKKDATGPFPLCAVYTSYSSDHFNLKIPQGKAVVISCADWLDNGHFQMLGNRIFFQSIYQFLENETYLSIPPTEQIENATKLIISQQKFLTLILNFLLLPFIFLIGGFITTIIRKE